jgi:hypothetical protein
MRSLAVLFALILIVSATSSTRNQTLIGEQAPLFERALAQAGLTLDDVRIDPDDSAFFGGDKYRLPFFDSLMNNPWKVSPYLRGLGDQLVDPVSKPADVLLAAQSRLSQGVRLGLLGDPAEAYRKRVTALGAGALDTALSELSQYARDSGDWEVVSEASSFATGPQLSDLPAPVRDSAALILLAVTDVLELRRAALTEPIERLGLDPQQVYEQVIAATLDDAKNDDVGGARANMLLIESLLDNVDFQQLNTGAMLLASVVQAAAEQLDTARADLDGEFFGTTLWTPYGYVQLTSDRPQGIEQEGRTEWLLVITTADGPAVIDFPTATCQSFGNSVSVHIDLRSDSTYAAGCGAGSFGYALLFDLGGNDAYRAEHMAQGYGMFGSGLLYDAQGNDSYAAVTNSQGCGIYGSGVLLDGQGSDKYDCYQYSQGYGFTRGVGMLVDRVGDDSYVANDTDIRFSGPQTAEHNTSMSQGVGNGRRGDYVDGHSWAGGVGMLVDGAGDDSYTCGVFGQGCAYWYGVGMLVDKAGADAYSGVWYVQGAGAHFALAALQDDAGNDKYTATMNMAQGAGHDFTLGWLEDSAGNDSYSAPNLSLGGANANGIGVCWDKAGDDTYLSSGVTLGGGGGVLGPGLRPWMLNLGIFVDGGGRDGYWENKGADVDAAPWDFAGDGKAWQRPGMSDPAVQHEFGVGIDG